MDSMVFFSELRLPNKEREVSAKRSTADFLKV